MACVAQHNLLTYADAVFDAKTRHLAPNATVAFGGDSIMDGLLHRGFVDGVNVAQGGDTTYDMLRRWRSVIHAKVNGTLISHIGLNDLRSGQSPECTHNMISRLNRMIRPHAHPIFLTVLEAFDTRTTSPRLNHLLAKDPTITLFHWSHALNRTLLRDGVHPDDRGNALLAAELTRLTQKWARHAARPVRAPLPSSRPPGARGAPSLPPGPRGARRP